MASLVNRINQTLIRRNGQLIEESPTPTSQLAGQAGLGAPPTTPVGVGALGATSKQIDMAGSGAQKQSALRQSLDTSNTLQEAQQDKRYRSAMTADEQAQAEKQKRLGEVFGSTQQKVQSLIDTEMSKLAPPAQPTAVPNAATPQLTVTGLTAADPSKQADVDAELAALIGEIGDPTRAVATQNRINTIMQLTGITDPKQISAAASDAAQQQVQSGAGAAAAKQLVDSSNVNVSALLPQLGTTREELASLLGVDPATVDTMSLDALNEAVTATASQGPNLSAAETDAASQSGSLGAAERAAMRERSAEQSTSGVAASEAQLEDLGRSLESADTVAFGGRNWTTQELLSDDSISKLVSDYLTNPDSPASKALESDPNSAGLLSFVNKYRETLESAAKQVGTATTENTAIQQANSALAEPVKGVKVPDSVMAAIYGDSWGTPQASKMPPSGILIALQQLGTVGAQKLGEPLNVLLATANADPQLAKDISGFTAEKLQKFLTKDKRGITPFEQLQTSRDLQRKVAADATSGNVDDLIALYFGGPTDWSTVPEPIRKELGLDLASVARAVGGNAGNPAAYQKGLVTLLSNKLNQGISTADTPEEVNRSNAGWTPVSLSGRIEKAETAKKSAAEASTKQKSLDDRVAALEKYLDKQGITGTQRQDILKRETATYKSELGIH